jgi:Amt family ammonium transporter
VVHITSGVSALICATYLGRRLGYPTEPMPPHSVVLSFIGACLLWVGWFGFNAGSALSAGSLATSAFVATHFAAASAAIGWAGAEWIRNGKPSALGAISGCVAGLVAITPAAGFVGPMPALLIGLIVHGVGGTIGALLTGVFATKLVNPIFKDGQGSALAVGVVDGNYHQMLNQMVGIAMAIALAVVGTYIILRVVDFVLGVRVSAEQEEQGLDVTQHGEEGYYWEVSLP